MRRSKMKVSVCSLVVLVLVVCAVGPSRGQQQVGNSGGYRLPSVQDFLVLAPHTVRPMQTYEIHTTLFRLHYTDITVRAVLSRDGEEYATAREIFNAKGTKRMQLMVPEQIQNGTHKLVVEGLVMGGRGDPVFHNETRLVFESKYISIFVQTDKPMYYPPSTVNFRVVGVTPELRPVHGQAMIIYIRDSLGNIVRRWLNQELNFGLYSHAFNLSYPVNIGTWHILVETYGHKYEQPFEVDFFYRRRFEVNITTPMYVFDTEWGFSASLYGEHFSSKAATGNATIELRVREENGEFMDGSITKKLSYMTGTVPLEFSMSDLTDKWGDLAGKDLFFKAWIFDWHWVETNNGTSVTRVVKDGINMKALGPQFRTFKPGIPFTVYYAVSQGDGSPYKGFYNRQVQLTVQYEGTGVALRKTEETVVIPTDAIVRYMITPREEDHKIKITAWHLPAGNTVELYCYKFYSRNNQYLSITTSTEVPTTNEYMTFTVRTNFFVEDINYMITAGGNILLGNMLNMYSQQKTFAVALSRQMAPRARILVYCVKDGEILTDSLNFFVKDSRLFNASIVMNYGKDFTQDTVEVVGRGDPGAFIALNGMDYEWYRRGADTFLDETKIVRELMTYDNVNEGPYKHTWYYADERWEGDVFFTAPTGGIDTITTFNVSGLVALSDLNFTIKQEFTACNRSQGVGICLTGQCYDLRDTCDGQAQCIDGYDEAACPMNDWELTPPRPPNIKDLHRVSRYFENDNWMWKSTYVKPNGQVEMKLTVPEVTVPNVLSAFVLHPVQGLSLVERVAMEVIALAAENGPPPAHEQPNGKVELKLTVPEENQPTVMSAFILHPVQGLSLVDSVIMHDTTRRFYMTSEAPEVTRRGEQIGIRLGLFNNWDQDLEVIVMLHGGENYRFVNVEDFGYVSSYSPRLSSGDVQVMVELPAGIQKYIYMPVVPIFDIGEITVRMSAFSHIDRDTEEVTIRVLYDGVTNMEFIPFLVDLNNKGSLLAPYFDIPIPQQFIVPGERDMLYIPGSNQAYVYTWGDVVSPGFYEPYLDTENTVNLPDDSAEGYMFDYAINLHTLRYLKSTQALDGARSTIAQEYMKSVLMRQYAYMQEDGSYKMFRRDSEPCVWLTSFVLKTLHDTLDTQWADEIFIPVEIVNKIALWLASVQQEDGSFHETASHYYDRNFLPNTTDKQGVVHDWHIPVTAHVVITLATANRATGEAKVEATEAKDSGADYLSSKLGSITDPFQMAITAYALQMAKHRDRDNAFQTLRTMNTSDENVYWAGVRVPPNPFHIKDAMYYMEPREDYVNLQNAVMATSYAMMLYIQYHRLEEAVPIMRWLVDQHLAPMQWSSTQDTLMALQALTAFALEESNRNFFNIEIRLEATSDPDWKQVVNVNHSNFQQLQIFELPNAWGQLKAVFEGTGYAFVGVKSVYHVEKERLMDNPVFKTYEFQMRQMEFTGRNASNIQMTPCTRWVRPDISARAEMTVMQVNMPSGYVVRRDTIEALYVAGVPGLKRIRFRDQQIIFFLEYVTMDWTCITFQAERWYPIANTSIAHKVSIKEYSETGLQVNKLYETYTLFHLHICQVCGSFQCPYCPYYNPAPAVTPVSLPVMLLAAALGHIFANVLSWDRDIS